MYTFQVALFSAALLVSNAFLFDSLFGPSNKCKTDADCSNGCCAAYVTSVGDKYQKCGTYLLPAEACYVGVNKGCGCTPGYDCVAPASEGLALEPSTKLKGFCKPVNGTSGPQIAVEGGR